MLFLDYDWDLDPNGIYLDPEIRVEGLGWNPGDLFRLVRCGDRWVLQKLDPLEKFVRGHDAKEE